MPRDAWTTAKWGRVWLALGLGLVVSVELIPGLADQTLAALGAGFITGAWLYPTAGR